MSGDVQPRKRNKDKKRRRDDEETRPTGVHATKMGPDDIQLHVHSDHGTGGHWCAKIFFFSLLAVLLGLIGLILLENRGLADLDTPLSESRFADMLEGWVDEEREVHDEHDVHLPDSHEHDDEDHDEHDEHDDGEEEHDQEDDEPLNSKENDHQEQDEDEIDLQKDDPEDDKETDEGFDESTENVATADEDDDEDENDDDNDDNDDNDEGNDKIDDDDEDENEVENDDQADEDEDEDDNKNEDNDEDEGIVDQDNDELNNDVDEVSKFDDEDTTDDDQTTEPALDDDENEIESNDDQPAEEQEEPEDESSSLAVRISVGLALVIVARQVLLKRPETNNDELNAPSDSEKAPEEEPPEFFDMKRRFTLVTAEEPIPPSEEDMTEHLIILEKMPQNDESVATNVIQSEVETPATFLNQPVELEYSDEDDVALPELDLHDDSEQKGNGLDEELLSDEVDEEEEDELTSEGHDYESDSSMDDSDLLKRLDEKYGKLPTHSDEDNDPNYDIDDEDIDPTWTKIDRSGPASAVTEDQLLQDDIRRANKMLTEEFDFQ